MEVMNLKKMESITQYNEIIDNENVILMFSADWCPDCRFIEPVLPEIESENRQFTFFYVDRDQFIDLCGDLNVFGIPSFVAFNQGTEIGRLVNKDRKTKEEIQAFIDSLMA
jgi:thiol-disulfide isomerase/thioredoxin